MTGGLYPPLAIEDRRFGVAGWGLMAIGGISVLTEHLQNGRIDGVTYLSGLMVCNWLAAVAWIHAHDMRGES